ncbi:MAG TPA: biopolymer transporter ExbD [bacterium]|nr:biopolymer transporter ExbD [bacterium]
MNNYFDNKNSSILSNISITNLVDVALNLVIMLLMMAPLIEQGIEVKLPESSPSKVEVEKSVVITVAKDETYYLGSTKITLRDLYKELKEKKGTGISVIVKGDKDVSYNNIIKVLDIIKECEIEKVGLATQVK